LVAGALRKENFINYYIGSIARKILRKSPCSVLIFTEPSTSFKKIDNILIDIENTPLLSGVMEAGLQQAALRKAKTIHFVRELKLYGLSLSVLSEYSMDELSIHRKNFIANEIVKIEKTVEKYDVTGFDTRIKILTGKAGYELRRYARKIRCDLLVMGAMENKLRLVDRLFMNNLEFIVEDIPCNLLIVKSKD
jgi:nucleotide-binding universal stress UspA family protein